jgi:hypothetical protein
VGGCRLVWFPGFSGSLFVLGFTFPPGRLGWVLAVFFPAMKILFHLCQKKRKRKRKIGISTKQYAPYFLKQTYQHIFGKRLLKVQISSPIVCHTEPCIDQSHLKNSQVKSQTYPS